MSNPLGAMNLSGILRDAGRAVWGTSSHALLQLPDQADHAWIDHLPLPVLEKDRLHASLGLSIGTSNSLARQFDSKQHLYSVLSTLALAIKARDAQLYLHSRRVQSLAIRLAQAMNLPQAERVTIGLAALFHDIGKICIDTALLHKAASLTSQEFEVIKEHPTYGALILGQFRVLKNVVPMVYHHHERWDGNGYPGELQGEAIPLGARIVAIADAFEVMTSHRDYQATRTPAEALEELYLCAGTQFDLHLVERFSTLVGSINLRPVGQPNPTTH